MRLVPAPCHSQARSNSPTDRRCQGADVVEATRPMRLAPNRHHRGWPCGLGDARAGARPGPSDRWLGAGQPLLLEHVVLARALPALRGAQHAAFPSRRRTGSAVLAGPVVGRGEDTKIGRYALRPAHDRTTPARADLCSEERLELPRLGGHGLRTPPVAPQLPPAVWINKPEEVTHPDPNHLNTQVSHEPGHVPDHRPVSHLRHYVPAMARPRTPSKMPVEPQGDRTYLSRGRSSRSRCRIGSPSARS